MYESTPTRSQNYSPLPARHYVRATGFSNTYPASAVMRNRDQAWWNLIWLTTPEVDRVLTVIDEPTHAAYMDTVRDRIESHIWPLARLFRKPALNADLPLKTALKLLPPRAFVEYFATLPYQDYAPFQDRGDELLALMRERAVLAGQGRLYLLNHPDGQDLGPIAPADHARLIAPSEAARRQWLTRAYRRFRAHVVRCGFPPPRVTFRIGAFTLSLQGSCRPAFLEDGRNRIEIAPRMVHSRELLDTFAHEVAHAIDDCRHGHSRTFVTIANRLGLQGSTMPVRLGPELEAVLDNIVSAIGPYPHFVAEFR